MHAQAVDTYIKYNRALRMDLQIIMQQGVNRIFRWVSLVIEELEHENAKGREVVQIINHTPQDPRGVYTLTMKQVMQPTSENLMYCRQLLSIVGAAYRPLTLSELGLLSNLPGEGRPFVIRGHVH